MQCHNRIHHCLHKHTTFSYTYKSVDTSRVPSVHMCDRDSWTSLLPTYLLPLPVTDTNNYSPFASHFTSTPFSTITFCPRQLWGNFSLIPHNMYCIYLSPEGYRCQPQRDSQRDSVKTTMQSCPAVMSYIPGSTSFPSITLGNTQGFMQDKKLPVTHFFHGC